MKKRSLLIIGLIIAIVAITLVLWWLLSVRTSDFKIMDEKDKIEQAKQYGDEVVGWIRVEGTNIDMALIQGTTAQDVTNMEYQFAWTNAFPDENSNHFTYISHNVRNVSGNPIVGDDSMTYFEQLMSFIYPEFIEENQFIEFTNPDGETSIYKIFGVTLIDEPQYSSYYDTFSDEELEEYIKKAKDESMYDIDVDVNSNDMLLTLYTCTRFYGDGNSYSFRVDARELREGESMKYSKVEVNNNYKVIEERMKEGEKDEEV